MHDVATFLVRRDHRLARDIRDLIQLHDHGVAAHPDNAGRLVRLRLALDAALADWLDERPLPSVTTTAGNTEARTTTSGTRGVLAGTSESRR